MKFEAEVLLAGKTATGIQVPDEVVAALGSGRKPAVRVTVGGHTYRSTVAVRGDRYLLPLSADNRTAAGVEAGDRVTVEVELDTAPREVTVPPDLAAALAADRAAGQFFESLSFSHKQAYVQPIEQAKAAETRERRIAKTVQMLREGRKR